MSKKYTGSCACGAVTYGFDSEPSFIANCHCTDCKRSSGGEMATFAAVPDADFTVSGADTTKTYSYGPDAETCAGKGLDRVFCTNCGSRAYTNNLKDFPGIVFVQEGTLDRLDEWFPPQAEIFTWSREKWLPALDIAQYDHRAPA
ncbi:Uncharacterized conserved protein [Asanoa ishikariensis]|uniref:Uncharacterized conserved protein n=1 Tax=Asanoa ishikariensis TaxID=137265 RepID=A0A1H3TDY0_9ACTN|nr:GFA family protein [Asanoa ishikariensis]SDZ48041.1 Uncharacterized conserved protein [Asanoa ishikariensis]